MQRTLQLETLKLQNFATFASTEINFSTGLNAIVGETGSGKSLILDALQLVFGGRADKKAVRLGAETAIIEACLRYEDPAVTKALEDLGFSGENGEIVIKRMVKRDGTSKCWLNHMACGLQQLSTFTRRWVDLVGQFENQKLLSDTYQLRLLDQYGSTTEMADDVRTRLKELRNLRDQRDSLTRSAQEREQRLDYLRFQLAEISTLNPREGEEDELTALKGEFMNHERKQLLLHQVGEWMEGDDHSGGITSLIHQGRSLITKNSSLLPSSFLECFATLEVAAEDMREACRELNSREMDQEEMQKVLERLDEYQRLKRKFGGSVAAMIEAREQFEREASKLGSAEEDLSDLLKRLDTIERALFSMAEELHNRRLDVATRFSSELTKAVRALRMDGAEIRLELDKTTEVGDYGVTQLHFLAQTNPGEGFHRVKEIASGGELSRILLALRQLLASHDSISIFLFDEIDTGMGGETALHIGKALQKVSKHSQVITITHLPQIAACADNLIVVSKGIARGDGEERTESRIREVEGSKAIRAESEAMVPLH